MLLLLRTLPIKKAPGEKPKQCGPRTAGLGSENSLPSAAPQPGSLKIGHVVVPSFFFTFALSVIPITHTETPPRHVHGPLEQHRLQTECSEAGGTYRRSQSVNMLAEDIYLVVAVSSP